MKNTCFVCEKPIEQPKGKAIIRCAVCNNPVHEAHSEECAKCKEDVCMNDIIYKEREGICKDCSTVTKTGRKPRKNRTKEPDKEVRFTTDDGND